MEAQGKKASTVAKLQEVKHKSGKSYNQIAAETGLTNVYVAQLLKRQAQLKPETAPKLKAALPELNEEMLKEMMHAPLRSYDPHLIQEPTVYGLNEAVMHFGKSIKEIINEEFGDGIMSAIDFFCSVDKVQGVDGKDRVVVTFDGKYLPYSEQDSITVIKEWNSQIDSCSGSTSVVPLDEKSLFVEATGDFKKGCVFGLGSESSRVKRRLHASTDDLGQSPNAPSAEVLNKRMKNMKNRCKKYIEIYRSHNAAIVDFLATMTKDLGYDRPIPTVPVVDIDFDEEDFDHDDDDGDDDGGDDIISPPDHHPGPSGSGNRPPPLSALAPIAT